MLIQEKIIVALAILAASFYLIRVTIAKYAKRRGGGSSCGGCGCGNAPALKKIVR